MLNIFLPSNLKLEELLNANPPNFSKKGKLEIDYFKYILNLITYLPSKSRENKEQKEDVYARISSKVLKPIIYNYQLYIRYFIENGVIEYDNESKWLANDHSKGYRFSEYYKNVEFISDTITDKKLLGKIFENYNSNEFSKKEFVNYEFLTKWFNDDFILNKEKSIYFVNNILIYKEESFHKKVLQKQRIQTILDKRYYFKVDNKGYRFHSILTNLKSELRNYLTYGGEELVSIDLSNSQPFLATLLLNPLFYNSTKQLLNIYDLPNFQEIIDKLEVFDKVKLLVKNDSQKLNKEIATYVYWVKSGNFYENFANAIEKKGIIIHGETSEQKKKMLKVYFSLYYFLQIM